MPPTLVSVSTGLMTKFSSLSSNKMLLQPKQDKDEAYYTSPILPYIIAKVSGSNILPNNLYNATTKSSVLLSG